MTISLKRVLIFFSVALNIGFVVMALFHTYNRPVHGRDQRWNELISIVEALDLPGDKTAEVKTMMTDFKGRMDELDKEQKTLRMAVLDIMAAPGALDQARLQAVYEDLDRISRQRSDMFRAHTAQMRRVMGDENGARFFGDLKRHILAGKKNSHG